MMIIEETHRDFNSAVDILTCMLAEDDNDEEEFLVPSVDQLSGQEISDLSAIKENSPFVKEEESVFSTFKGPSPSEEKIDFPVLSG